MPAHHPLPSQLHKVKVEVRVIGGDADESFNTRRLYMTPVDGTMVDGIENAAPVKLLQLKTYKTALATRP